MKTTGKPKKPKIEPPVFDADGFQTNIKDLNGTPLPDLSKVQTISFWGGAREGAGRKCQAARLVCQHRRTDRRQFEAITVLIIQQARSGLTPQPFEQPALLQARALCKLSCSDRARAFERLVQSKPIPDVNHQRHHLALLVAPYRKRVALQLIRIECVVRHGGHRVLLRCWLAAS